MLSDILQKLEAEHGIDPAQGQNILNTITQQITERFPAVGGILNGVLGQQATTTQAQTQTTSLPSTGQETTLQKLEDMVKGKLGGLI